MTQAIVWHTHIVIKYNIFIERKEKKLKYNNVKLLRTILYTFLKQGCRIKHSFNK